MHPGSTALCLERTMQSKTKTIITVEPPVSDYPKCQAKWSFMEQDLRPYSVNIFLIRIWLTHAPMLKECFIYERKQFWDKFLVPPYLSFSTGGGHLMRVKTTEGLWWNQDFSNLQGKQELTPWLRRVNDFWFILYQEVKKKLGSRNQDSTVVVQLWWVSLL